MAAAKKIDIIDINVKVDPIYTGLDRRILAQRERLGHVDHALWGLWFDVHRRYGSGSPPWSGSLLALVREAWGNCHVVECPDGFWRVAVWPARRDPTDPSLPLAYVAYGRNSDEALVAAFEAAPAHSSDLADPSSNATSDAGR